MGGIQDKVESPRSHAEIENILNNLQERLNTHDNRITGDGFRMGEFSYASFGYLKDGVLKEMPRGGFVLFMDAWYLCALCSMYYTSESSFLERGKKVRGMNFKSSGESRVARNFYQRYPAFLVGHSTRDVVVGTLLPGLSTLDKWSQAGTFGTRHELDIELKNATTQLPAEICLYLQGRMQSVARKLLESSYNFMMTLLIYTDAEISILPCQGFSEKNIPPI